MIVTLPARIEALEANRRRVERQLIKAPAGLALGDDGLAITILDLSEDGFRAIVPGELRIDGWVRLTLKDLPAPEAQVKWRRGSEHGFSFAFPLYAEFVAAALSGAAASPEVALAPSTATGSEVAMSWSDYRAGRCRLHGEPVALSPLMTEIVSTLLMRRGEQLSGMELARAVWPDRRVSRRDMATLHVLICRIRERLPDMIETIDRGSYMIGRPAN